MEVKTRRLGILMGNNYFVLSGLVLFFLSLSPLSLFASTKLYVETGNLSPNSGTIPLDQTITFTSNFYDSINYKDIQYVRFMVNTTSVSFKNCLSAIYSPLLNKFYLLDDSGKKNLGGFAPGSNNIIENSYCRLDCSKSTVNGSGNTLTVNWAVSFKPAFTGNENLYLYIKGTFTGYDGWDKKGTINIVTDATVPTGTITINNDSIYTNSTSVTLNLSAQDNSGGSGVSQMQFSNDNVTWLTPEPYTTTKSLVLTSGDGEKTVYVKFSDNAGNWSQVYSDKIILDTSAPELNITSPLDNELIWPE